MLEQLAPLRGMKDLLPKEYLAHKYIEDIAYNTAKLYGYQGFSTPILESTNVFDRTLGLTSDVISKEIYSFQDKKGRQIAMRPEFTAGIMRAVISNNLYNNQPLKLFSTGPLFRYDRPQEGRQRQFHQINFEYIGANGAYSDAETLSLASRLLESLGLLDYVQIELNSLGCQESRAAYHKKLTEYFGKYANELSEDSRRRLDANPLRILDSKDEKDRDISSAAPLIHDSYTKESAQYFAQVQEYLNMFGVGYKINPYLARGLDYYCHTTFEFTTDRLGAQATVLAGGRYDGLAQIMGSNPINAIGFAAGIERLKLMMSYSPASEKLVYIIPIGDEAVSEATRVAQELRSSNISAVVSLEGKVTKRMQIAVASGASHALFLGEDEIKNSVVTIKDLGAGVETSVLISNLSTFFDSVKF